MIVAVPCVGQLVSDNLDPRFGRAAFFIIVDTETLSFSVINNAARSAGGGAGIAAAQSVIDQHIEAVIAGQLGPNALNVLSSADIALYQGIPGSVSSNIEAFNQNKLSRITESGPSHSGLGSMQS